MNTNAEFKNDSNNATSRDQPDAIPTATVRKSGEVAVARLRTRLWWLVGLCVLLAIALVWISLADRGTPITIRFANGFGLKEGDSVRYRGIEVGTVLDTRLTDEADGVEVEVSIFPGSKSIAVEGSQFWIERAQLRLGQVTGIDTVLGAKYIGVLPGSSPKYQAEFDGLDSPLVIRDGDSVSVEIEFPRGEGLQVGDPLQYRGISIGEVTYVELNETASAVVVRARLIGNAKRFARVGTQFWVERPRLDITEVRGLETLLGGRYVAVQPISSETNEQLKFVGLAEPPPLPRQENTLQVELDAPTRMGLVRGAPILYRGLEVGRVGNVSLSRDSASVKIAAVIDGEYADLLRDNSKWWSIGGVEVDAGLSGFNVSIDSLASWIRGGVAFATPSSPGRGVVTGHRFMLEKEPQSEWLEWQPRIAIRSNKSGESNLELPQAKRVVARWRASLLGLYQKKSIETWGLALDDGNMVLPRDFIVQARAAGGEVQLETAGTSFSLPKQSNSISEFVWTIPVPSGVVKERWATANVASGWTAEDTLLVVNPELTDPLAIDATRLSKLSAGGLQIAPGVAIPSQLEGSPVINARTGKIYGMLVVAQSGWVVAAIGD